MTMNSAELLIDLNEKLVKLLPEQPERPRYVTSTLNLLVEFMAGDKSTMTIKNLNKFQRKIIYVLCDQVDIGIKYSTIKSERSQHGSKTVCNCGATGKVNSYYEWDPCCSDECNCGQICKICNDSGFVRNFITTHITLTKS